MIPTPDLRDDVVSLRRWLPSDAPVRVEAGADADILRFTSVPAGVDTDAAEKWIDECTAWWAAGRAAYLVIEPVGTAVAAGSMGLIRIDWYNRRAEVGYWLLPTFRGTGLATPALRLLCDWAFADLGLERLELLTNLDNHASQAVAVRGSFRFEGTLRSYGVGRTGRETVHLYSRLPGDGTDVTDHGPGMTS